VLFSCLKPAADGSGDLVLRLYEPFGEGARATIEFSAPVAVGEADMMERSLRTLARASGTVEVDLDPFEITTLRIRPEW
jgi:alpha-mannosidase